MLNRTGILALAVTLIAGVALGMLFPLFRQRNAPPPLIIQTPIPTATTAPTATAAPTATPAPIQVYVNGAVAHPDVYEISPQGRVKQAVEAAGGFTAEANSAVVNLALPLVDGMHIYIPEISENTAVPETIISQPAARAAGGIELNLGEGRININTARAAELEQLPGIGPALAQRIIEYRLANGSFPSIEAIVEVSGIGETKFAQLRDLITVTD
ncbi:MAG: helix-hairpin-helix domain-containing protein [Candidatus Promineifilaceae bacterium]